MLRRSLLSLPALALLPTRLYAAVDGTRRPLPRVGADQDRAGKERAIGLSETRYKVLTSDSGGDLFVLEQLNRRKGGPSRHLHHHEDELFFCLEGEYIVEVGEERSHLKPGDCVLGPRGIPHVWAFAGGPIGRMLISFAPAGKMEAFFGQRESRGIKPGQYASTKEDAALLHEFGMELVGPPIAPDTF
ncbi:cupin domain-containing protein [Sphingomonas sp.]|uniref:cupin domain-containing protein n=1 Tax=Sphingomonas sp. TaxID=28214 RepID=UPI003D6CC375